MKGGHLFGSPSPHSSRSRSSARSSSSPGRCVSPAQALVIAGARVALAPAAVILVGALPLAVAGVRGALPAGLEGLMGRFFFPGAEKEAMVFIVTRDNP